METTLWQQLIDTTFYALQLFAELALLFVAISFLVGALQEWLPAEKTQHYLSAQHGRGYLIGALIGTATPFCSCSTVPLTLGLLKSGAGFGPTMTLLFTSPLVNPIIITLFWITFGVELTLLYCGMVISMTMAISWLMDRTRFERYLKADLFSPQPATVSVPFSSLKQEPSTEHCCTTPQSETTAVHFNSQPQTMDAVQLVIPSRARRLLNDAVTQFLSFLPHVLIGVAIGAVAHGFVPDQWLIEYAGADNFWAIPLAAIIGVPLYVRGSTMIPIALTLTTKGMGIGAVIALVIGGAGASLPEMVMLKRMFHWPILFAFLTSVFTVAITTGYLAQLLF